jgi:TonB family protein
VTPGGGFGDATYSRYMGSELQQRIQEDDRVNRLVFSADVSVWVDSNGRVTQVRILRSSGDAKTDDALVTALQGMPALDAPPASLQFPQKVAIRGRRM